MICNVQTGFLTSDLLPVERRIFLVAVAKCAGCHTAMPHFLVDRFAFLVERT